MENSNHQVIRYNNTYLKECNKCNKYDINCLQNTCYLCRCFFCKSCSKNDLALNDCPDENNRTYCNTCLFHL